VSYDTSDGSVSGTSFSQIPDPQTGELVERPTSATFIRPRGVGSILSAVAAYRPDDRPKHGGKRLPRCPEHPTADMVADGLALVGTLHQLAQQIGVGPHELRVALRELRTVGWVAVQTQPGARLTVRAERRSFGRQHAVAVERRQADQDAWPL